MRPLTSPTPPLGEPGRRSTFPRERLRHGRCTRTRSPLCRQLSSPCSSTTRHSTSPRCTPPLTDLINDDTTEGDSSLPPESGLEQQPAARAQGAADDVGLQDDDALGFLWAPLNLRQQQRLVTSQLYVDSRLRQANFTTKHPSLLCGRMTFSTCKGRTTI